MVKKPRINSAMLTKIFNHAKSGISAATYNLMIGTFYWKLSKQGSNAKFRLKWNSFAGQNQCDKISQNFVAAANI